MNTISPTVTAQLRFLKNRHAPALYLAAEAGGDIPEHQGDYVQQAVPVLDARIAIPDASLEREGFVLINQVSAVSDFYADKQVEEIYLPEIKALIRQQLDNALHVEIFDYTRRTSEESLRRERKLREAAAIVHNDYSSCSGIRTRDEYFERDTEATNTLGDKPFSIINVWRSINGVVQQKPLTVCDASSVASEDLIAVTRQAKNHTGELQLAVYNPAQRWYYYPQMQMDEALVFKTFDSRTDGRTRFLLHSAFDLPGATELTPVRESIEARCLVFFPA